jgi:hypothetical protein
MPGAPAEGGSMTRGLPGREEKVGGEDKCEIKKKIKNNLWITESRLILEVLTSS